MARLLERETAGLHDFTAKYRFRQNRMTMRAAKNEFRLYRVREGYKAARNWRDRYPIWGWALASAGSHP